MAAEAKAVTNRELGPRSKPGCGGEHGPSGWRKPVNTQEGSIRIIEQDATGSAGSTESKKESEHRNRSVAQPGGQWGKAQGRKRRAVIQEAIKASLKAGQALQSDHGGKAVKTKV